jgi:ribosomal protein L37E
MGNYQVLFSGEISPNVNEETVRANLARELGIDERKARQLFSGRTVVIKSQLSQADALSVQTRFSDFGAICRVKDFTPKVEKVDYRIDRADRENSDQTLKDITAAHHECPRCGHLQLEASHCARCGIDIAAAIKQQRKEDLIIQKKIRDLKRKDNPTPSSPSAESGEQDLHCEAGAQDSDEPKKRGVMGWLRKSS